jgi:hypothetical protein
MATQVFLNRHVHTASNICLKEDRQAVYARMRGKIFNRNEQTEETN